MCPNILGSYSNEEATFGAIRAATSENVPPDMCAQQRLISACASAQSEQSLRCPHEDTRVSCYPKCAEWRFWSDYADLNLHWAHMSEGTFPDVAVHMLRDFNI